MPGIADIYADVRLKLKSGEFQVSAAKEADSAGTTMAQRMSAKLGVGLAAGLGAAVGMAGIAGIGAAVGKVTDFFGDAIKGASDLAEQVSKAGIVFGPAITQVDDFAKTSATAFGISKQAAYEATSTFGNLFEGVGLGKDAAADMSVVVTGLAADLAAFNDVPTGDALAAIQSGLIGEAEPMRRFGVLLTEGAVKTKALAMGLADANGNLSESAKLQARYALILAGTTTAQGNFAQTSDGLAGTQKTLNAVLADTTAEIGQKLTPVVLKLAQAARDQGVPAVESLVDSLGNLLDASGREVDTIANAPGDFLDWLFHGDEPGFSRQARDAAAALDALHLAQIRAASGGADSNEERAAAAQQAVGNAVATQKAFEAQMQAGQSAIREAVRVGMSDPISAELSAAAKRSVGIATTWSADLGAALGSGEPGWRTALGALGTDMQSSMTKSAQAGYILAALNSKMIQNGLASGKTGIATETKAVVNTMLVTLDQMYGPAFLASYNFGSGVVNAAAKAIADGQLKAFGNASPGMAPIVPKYIAPKIPDYRNDPDYKAMMDAINGITTSSATATGAARTLAADAKAAIGDSFDKMKTSAHSFFDDLHNRILKGIDDTRDLANAQIDSQISALDAGVQAARDSLQKLQDARQLASLKAAVASATDPAALGSAQIALSDFLAQQHIDALAQDAQTKTDALNLQKKANDDDAGIQTTGENARYKAQTTAFDNELKGLQSYLDRHPAAWKATNDKVLKLLDDYDVPYKAAGLKVGKAFLDGLGATFRLPATTPATTATADPGATSALASMGSGGAAGVGEPVVLRIEVGGNKLLDWFDENLYYRRR